MKLQIQKDLFIIDICVIVLVLVTVLSGSEILRMVLGLPFVLFFPGYSLVSIFFLRRSDISIIERLALSLGLSIVLVSIAGLCLNYTPWGIQLYPLIITLSIFTIIVSSIAWYRRLRLLLAESAGVFTNLALFWRKGRGLADRLISFVLIIVILGMFGTLIYTISVPGNGEKFTEFYILNNYGQAAEYLDELSVGTEGVVIVGIVNRENAEVDYRIEVIVSGEVVKRVGPVILQHEQKWEQSVEFIPEKAGDNQKLEFLLFKGEEDTLYRSVHIWIDID